MGAGARIQRKQNTPGSQEQDKEVDKWNKQVHY